MCSVGERRSAYEHDKHSDKIGKSRDAVDRALGTDEGDEAGPRDDGSGPGDDEMTRAPHS